MNDRWANGLSLKYEHVLPCDATPSCTESFLADDIYKLRHLMFDMYFNWLTDREQGVKTHNTSFVDVVSV